jgi:hypothetical protein
MDAPYVRATVGAEVRRALRDRRPIDRDFLYRETGKRPSYVDLVVEQVARRMFNELARS